MFKENGYEEKQLQRTIKEVKDRLSRNNDDESRTDVDQLPTITLPWIPGVSPKLKKAYKRAGYKTVFKSAPNLQAETRCVYREVDF